MWPARSSGSHQVGLSTSLARTASPPDRRSAATRDGRSRPRAGTASSAAEWRARSTWVEVWPRSPPPRLVVALVAVADVAQRGQAQPRLPPPPADRPRALAAADPVAVAVDAPLAPWLATRRSIAPRQRPDQQRAVGPATPRAAPRACRSPPRTVVDRRLASSAIFSSPRSSSSCLRQ